MSSAGIAEYETVSDPAILSIAPDDQLNEATGFGLFLPKAVIKPAELLTFLLAPTDSSIKSAATESPLASAIAFCNLRAFSR